MPSKKRRDLTSQWLVKQDKKSQRLIPVGLFGLVGACRHFTIDCKSDRLTNKGPGVVAIEIVRLVGRRIEVTLENLPAGQTSAVSPYAVRNVVCALDGLSYALPTFRNPRTKRASD